VRGVGSAFGAVSFVNAMLSGQGCAAGISLRAEAEVTLLEAKRSTPSVRIPAESDTPLVRAALLASLRRFAPDQALSADLALRSNVPPAQGLKSSSAVAGAIFRATEDALRPSHRATEVEMAGLVAELGISVGLSATGGFDDALAGLETGVVVTDNLERRVLSRQRVPAGWELLLWLPRATHPPAPQLQERFASLAGEGREAVRLARGGKLLEAMERNTRAVEQALGLDERARHVELRRKGALGSGISGLGPALAVVLPAGRDRAVRAALPSSEGEVLSAQFVSPTREPR
jgi:shikimate kinase